MKRIFALNEDGLTCLIFVKPRKSSSYTIGMILDSISNAITLLPESVYTLALTGLGALVGINIGLKAHEKRERVSREMQMRRDVYLTAAEAVAKADEFVGRFSDSNWSNEHHQELIKDYAAHTAKIHVVGEIKTIKSLVAFNAKFVEIVWALNPLRNDLMQAKSKVDSSKNYGTVP